MLLSFIVPVYNTSSYLDRCLESLFLQNINNNEFEIIIVNDGSTDNSSCVIKKWSDSHNNITVITQLNQGLSIARNNGIEIARGEFVQFVDSDDWLEPNSLRCLLGKCKDFNLDIVSFDLQSVDQFGCKIHHPKNKNRANKVFSGQYLLSCANIQAPVPKYIIRLELIVNNKLKFFSNIFHEDEEFTPRLLLYANRVMLTNIVAYNYYKRSDSITQSPKNRLESFNNKVNIVLLMDELVKSGKLNPSQQISIANRNNQLIVDIIISILKLQRGNEYFIVFKEKIKHHCVVFSLSENLSFVGKVIGFLVFRMRLFTILNWCMTLRAN